MVEVQRNIDEVNQKDNVKWSYKEMMELEESIGSSFFILKMEQLRENYRRLERAFKSRYENFIIGYSYKTNYLPYLCKQLSSLGAYAEVVSRLEYDLALKIGEDPKRIIFNGPVKTVDDIDLALYNESIVNIDSLYEVEFVKRFALNNPNRTVKIGIRVNFDISENGHSILQDGYELSRFGICTENGSLEVALYELNQLDNINVVGFHGHFSTSNRSVESYRRKTSKLCHLAKQYLGEKLEFIDIGGGIYGELPSSIQRDVPSFEDYAESICQVMSNEFPDIGKRPKLILEPGVSMVANTFAFVAKVIETKKIIDKQYVVVDGSVHNIKPTMHKWNLPMQTIRRQERTEEKEQFHVVGYTCMEKDYLAYNMEDLLPERGDYIVFEHVGAYTIVFNPPFIKSRPAIIAIDGESSHVVRRQETFKQFFDEELYIFN